MVIDKVVGRRTWQQLVLMGSALALSALSGASPHQTAATRGPLTLRGMLFASNGAAAAGGRVAARCQQGQHHALTSPDGRFVLAIHGGLLPCVLQGTTDSGATTHAVVTRDAPTTDEIPIHLITDLALAALTRQLPAQVFERMDGPGDSSLRLTEGALRQAVESIALVLGANGIDPTYTVAAVRQVGPLTKHAMALVDAVMTRSGTSPDALTAAFAGHAAPMARINLPAELLLRTKASNCEGFAAGAYRVILFASASTPNASGAAVENVGRMVFDPAVMQLQFSQGAPRAVLTNGRCRFVVGPTEFVVSHAGVIVGRMIDSVLSPGNYRLFIGIPEQFHAVDELAGDWNLVGWQQSLSSTLSFTVGARTWTADGRARVVECGTATAGAGPAQCVPSGTWPSDAKARADGGFEWTDRDGDPLSRQLAYLYRVGDDRLLVTVSPGGGLSLGVRRKPLGLPQMGEATACWNVSVDEHGTAGDATNEIALSTHIVAGVDRSAMAFKRQVATPDAALLQSESIRVNEPSDGLFRRQFFRPAGAGRSERTVPDQVGMHLSTFGLTAYPTSDPVRPNGTATLFNIAVQSRASSWRDASPAVRAVPESTHALAGPQPARRAELLR